MTDPEIELQQMRENTIMKTALKTVDRFIQMEESMNATPFFEFKFAQDKKRLHPKCDISCYYNCTEGGSKEPCNYKPLFCKTLKKI